MADKLVKLASDWRVTALVGYIIIFLTFGIVGIWAAVTKINQAIFASGYVAVESNNKAVQHLEGGIVSEILVREGDHVREGQVLVRLQKVQIQANSDLFSNQLNASLAMESRLLAERDHKDELDWPEDFNDRSHDTVLAKLMSDELSQFHDRRAFFNSQVSVINSRIEQLSFEINGLEVEQDSAEKQRGYINTQLAKLRSLEEKHLVPMGRILGLESEKTRLDGIIGRLITDTAKAQSSIGELKTGIEQLYQKSQEDVAAALFDVRRKIADARERLAITQDMLTRADVVAPRTGTVQSLKVFTVGQVLRPGETFLEIVPDNERLVINAHFSTTDIDSIGTGQNAEIRFPAFHSREIPIMTGHLESISRDRILDEQTRQFYYHGVISLSRADIPGGYRMRILPGMSADVIVAVGERTVLSYLLSPLSGSLRKAFREQ